MPTSSPTLADYVSDVRNYLHDANANYWTDAQLVRYINKARLQVATDTGILRQVVTINLPYNTEKYSLDTVATGMAPISVMNIFVTWSQTRYRLQQLSWNDLNTQFRMWTSYNSYPCAYAIVGRNVYVAPTPDQAYTSEWDLPFAPTDLTTGGTEAQLFVPFIESICLYASYLAKSQDQQWKEADAFLQKYFTLTSMVANSAVFRIA
jgi:hypothetical protein